MIRATGVARSIAIEGRFLEIVGLMKMPPTDLADASAISRCGSGTPISALSRKTHHASSLVHRSFDVDALRLRGEPP